MFLKYLCKESSDALPNVWSTVSSGGSVRSWRSLVTHAGMLNAINAPFALLCQIIRMVCHIIGPLSRAQHRRGRIRELAL